MESGLEKIEVLVTFKGEDGQEWQEISEVEVSEFIFSRLGQGKEVTIQYLPPVTDEEYEFWDIIRESYGTDGV